MGIQLDELRKRLPSEVRERILRENWHSHDARWFLKVSLEYGFDVANKLNKSTLRSMARTEMRRLLEATKCSQVETVDDFVKLTDIAFEVYVPLALLEAETRVTGEGSFTAIVKKCFVFEEAGRAGVTETYECACGYRFEGWAEACGLRGELKILRSLMRGDPFCEISISSISSIADDEILSD